MSDTRKPGQIPLDFGHQAADGRDDLIVSDRLSAVVTLVDRWPDWPSQIVVLAGPIGSGKSHLTKIWSERAGAIAVTANAGDNHAMEAAASGPVFIEDIDRTGFDETTLFHLINTVHAHSTSLLMTSRLWPAAWNVTLPDLASRLKAATTVEIGEPDDDLLAQVLVKLFADRQIAADDRVVAYLVARMERSLATARTIVSRIDGLAMSRKTKISRQLAAEVLASMDGGEIDIEQS